MRTLPRVNLSVSRARVLFDDRWQGGRGLVRRDTGALALPCVGYFRVKHGASNHER